MERLGGRLFAIRPLDVGDILDGAFRGWRATFLPAALLIVVLLGPLQLLLNLALTSLVPEFAGSGFGDVFGDLEQPTEASFEVPSALLSLSIVGGVISFLLTLVVSASVVALVLQVDRGHAADAGAAIREAARVLGTTLGASLVLVLGGLVAVVAFIVLVVLLALIQPVVAAIFGFLILLPAAVILGAAFFGATNMVVPIVVIEQHGVGATLRRAVWVLRRRFWRVVGVSLLIGLLVGIVGFVAQLPFAILAAFTGGAGWVFESVGQVLTQVISIPVTVIAVLLLYLDARVRYEGLDLQLRSRGVRWS